jgi:hypothetical protein
LYIFLAGRFSFTAWRIFAAKYPLYAGERPFIAEQ